MNTYLIVTDGSSISANNSTGFDAAAAYIIYKNGRELQRESILLENHTNNYAEMYAIYKGTKWLYENEDKTNLDRIGNNVLIITDSQLCEKSLNDWMNGWLKKTDNEVLMSTTGKVKNQELVKSAYINILLLNLLLPTHVCHINSHKSENEIPKMYKKFIDKYFDIEYKEFELIYKANQIVDELAYNKLNKK